MKKVIILIASMLFSMAAHSEGFKSEESARKFADSLVQHFLKKEFKLGLNKSKKYWPIPEVEIDGLANTINQQWPIVDQRFGEAIDIEFVKEKKAGKSLLRYYYLHKFENHAIYWQIDLYKPKSEWQINQIMFLDTLENLY